jgi:hypothetical protein
MSNPAWITVDVAGNLRDNPPWDQGLPEDLIPELAQTICERFDSTAIYDQLDQLACALLRERGLGPEGASIDQPS